MVKVPKCVSRFWYCMSEIQTDTEGKFSFFVSLQSCYNENPSKSKPWMSSFFWINSYKVFCSKGYYPIHEYFLWYLLQNTQTKVGLNEKNNNTFLNELIKWFIHSPLFWPKVKGFSNQDLLKKLEKTRVTVMWGYHRELNRD